MSWLEKAHSLSKRKELTAVEAMWVIDSLPLVVAFVEKATSTPAVAWIEDELDALDAKAGE